MTLPRSFLLAGVSHRKETMPRQVREKKKLAAVQFYDLFAVGFDVPTHSQFVKRPLQGVSRAHSATGTPRRARRPVSWKMFIHAEHIISARRRECRML